MDSANHAVSVGLLDQGEIDTAGGIPGTLYDLTAIDAIGARVHPTLPERPEVFAEKLREFLIEPYPDGTDPRERPYGCITPRWIQLRTDYQAQGLLALAAKAAGISDMAFPFKTVLLIKHGCIIERDGFGKKIFEGPAPEGPFGID